MSKMNLPNKLTIFRVILIVPFIILLLGGQAGWFGDNTFVPDMIALAIFIIASLTDLIDGKIARKYNLITDFGKFMEAMNDVIAYIDKRKLSINNASEETGNSIELNQEEAATEEIKLDIDF